MLSKNLSFGTALWKLPFRVLLDALSAWRGLLSGDGGYFVAIFRAHLHFIGWLLWNKKYSVFPVKRGGKLTGVYEGSVVWAYFIQKKKTFLEIVADK